MKNISSICIAIFLLFMLPASAFSVQFQPAPKVNTEYFHCDAVFTGTVLAERADVDKDDYINGWWYSVKVSKVFSGHKKDVIEVYTENTSGRFCLTAGQEYLLFAGLVNNELQIGSGGNSGLLSESKEKIKQLEQIPQMTDGEIEGQVVAQENWQGLEGIKVTLHGNGKTLIFFTDKDGWFRVRVNPGKYRATVEDSTIAPYGLSYDDPKAFEVYKGGGAELQFVRERGMPN